MPALLEPLVLARLQSMKYLPRQARASSGVGDRPSRSIGPGIEFAEYREYQPGDDVRHIDRHVYARHRRLALRRFVVDQQLRVAVLLDTTASMAHIDAAKGHRARLLAAAAGAIALFGGDRTRMGGFQDDRVDWLPMIRSSSGLGQIMSWLDVRTFRGSAHLGDIARKTSEQLSANDLLIVISDWMMEGVEQAIRHWAAKQVEVVGIQVLSPFEITPPTLGPARLADAESGTTMDVTLDEAGIEAYRNAFDAWTTELGERLHRSGGRLLASSSTDSLEDALFLRWRKEGLVT